jgi:hypothetical protein
MLTEPLPSNESSFSRSLHTPSINDVADLNENYALHLMLGISIDFWVLVESVKLNF